MPMKPLRPCLHIGCPELVQSGYCINHIQDAHMYDRYRGTAAERGYNNVWVKFRIRYLRVHPLCVDCLKSDRVTPATDVHHVCKLRDGGDRLDANNCMSLCHKHHSERTARGE
jgi:5-methylcytosine-specific restriction protein A